jgi:predicted membrane-bound spermidine synthase
MNSIADIRLRRIFYLLFAFSGLTGLIYESIWSHYMKLFLGHAAYAQTLVLAIFMGGMAIGSWLCSRYSFHWRNLFLWYVIEEVNRTVCTGVHNVLTRLSVFIYRVIPIWGR